jgi:hypothetical protein
LEFELYGHEMGDDNDTGVNSVISKSPGVLHKVCIWNSGKIETKLGIEK